MDLLTIKVVLGLSVPFLLATLWAVIHAAQKEFGSLREKVDLDDGCRHSFYRFYYLSDIRFPEKGIKLGEMNE